MRQRPVQLTVKLAGVPAGQDYDLAVFGPAILDKATKVVDRGVRTPPAAPR